MRPLKPLYGPKRHVLRRLEKQLKPGASSESDEGPDSPRSGCPVQAVVPDSLREAGQLRGTGGEAPHSSLAERGWNPSFQGGGTL